MTVACLAISVPVALLDHSPGLYWRFWDQRVIVSSADCTFFWYACTTLSLAFALQSLNLILLTPWEPSLAVSVARSRCASTTGCARTAEQRRVAFVGGSAHVAEPITAADRVINAIGTQSIVTCVRRGTTTMGICGEWSLAKECMRPTGDIS